MDTHDSNGAAPEVEIEIHELARTAIVTLRGEHDLTTQSRVRDALTLAGEQPTVLVDLSECTFADTSLINSLIVANAIITQRAGHLEVVIPPQASSAHRLAKLTRLEQIMPIHATRNGLPRSRESPA
jgi:stage II sporulation protein AA (anti-sigma F factor antagonist)